MDVREVTLDADGVDIAVMDFGGSGTPVVLLHGGSRTAADWLSVAPLLSPRRVVAVDFRGHGRSSREDVFTLANALDDVRAVVHSLAPSGAFLVGHSLGGIVAVMVAAELRECLGAVNIDGYGAGHPSQFDGLPADQVERTLAAMADRSISAMLERVDAGDEAWRRGEQNEARAWVESLGVSHDLSDAIVGRSFRQVGPARWERSPNNATMVSMYRALRGLDLRPSYARIEKPLLLLRAQPDPTQVSDPEYGHLVRAYVRGLARQLDEIAAARTTTTVEQVATGHMVHLEAPEMLAARVRTFIGAVEQPAA